MRPVCLEMASGKNSRRRLEFGVWPVQDSCKIQVRLDLHGEKWEVRVEGKVVD